MTTKRRGAKATFSLNTPTNIQRQWLKRFIVIQATLLTLTPILLGSGLAEPTKPTGNILATSTSPPPTLQPHLVEWFTATDCEECQSFEEQTKSLRNDGVVWNSYHRYSPSVPRDSLEYDQYGIFATVARSNAYGVSTVPSLLLDGEIMELNGSVTDSALKLEQLISEESSEPLVRMGIEVSLVDSSGDDDPDDIKVDIQLEPLLNLSDEAALVVLLVEDHPEQGQWRVARLYRYSHEFYVSEGAVTNWSETFDAAELLMAGVTLSPDKLPLLRVNAQIIDPSSEKTLAVNSISLPTTHQNRSQGDVVVWLLLALIITGGLGMVVYQERLRETGIPRIKGTAISDGDDLKVRLTLTTGNRNVTIKSVTVDPPWRFKQKPKRGEIAKETVEVFTHRLYSKSKDEITFHLELDIDLLGGWVLDLRIPLSD